MAAPRLVKTQVEMEGRYEERWVLVEEEGPPPMAEKDELSIVGQARAADHRPEARLRRCQVRLGHLAARHAPRRRCCARPHAHATVELDLDAARAMPARARGAHARLTT